MSDFSISHKMETTLWSCFVRLLSQNVGKLILAKWKKVIDLTPVGRIGISFFLEYAFAIHHSFKMILILRGAMRHLCEKWKAEVIFFLHLWNALPTEFSVCYSSSFSLDSPLLYSLIDPYVNFLAQVCHTPLVFKVSGGRGEVWIPGALKFLSWSPEPKVSLDLEPEQKCCC